MRHAVGRTRPDLDRDELLALGLTKLLEIIGEAARGVTPKTRELAPSIPWAKIVGARHVMIHEYFRLDRDLVWDTVDTDLAPLVAALEKLLAEIAAPPPPPEPPSGS